MSAERSIQAIFLTNDSGETVGVLLDGAVYRLQSIGKILNAASSIINPATEETLDSIKDTDGIKKITDALPAGTNVIGKFVLRDPGDTVDLGNASNPVRTDPTGTTTQPVSAASLPLPSGAATESTLSSIDGKDFATQTTLSSIDGKVATQTTLSAADTKLGTIDSVLDSIKDTDGIKKITDALPVGDNIIGRVKLTDGTNVQDILNDSGVYRGRVEAKIASGGANQKVVLVDGINTIELAVVDGATLPANTRALMIAGIDDESKSQFIAVEADGKLKSTAVPPTPPANTIETVYSQDESDLQVITPTYNPHDTDFVIPSGKTFYLQFLSGGSEGDPSEKGSKLELYYIDSASVSHIITRQYLYGTSIATSFPDTAKARDGTSMTGNGSTTKIRIRRERLSNSTGEIDVEARGYLKDT